MILIMFEKGNLNAQANYQVLKASKEQKDLVFDQFYKNESKRDVGIVFIAVDGENIIGYLVVEEKTVPPPLNGTDWFVWNIFTRTEFRRQGIASALLKETIKHAEQANVRHLIGSCTNTPAHMFWFKHNFCFFPYGPKIDNENNPNEHGNRPHMIFYRINKTEKENLKKQENYQIIKADKKRLHWIFDKYILNVSPQFFQDKREDISGLIAVDKDENILGFITAFPYELGSPIDGIQWVIPCIFVHPEIRRQGIDYALIREIINAAKESDVKQLTCLFLNEEASEFWYNNNFDICIYYIMNSNDGKMPVSAALRIL